jgi:flagellar motor switch protein FliN/FliY
MDDNQNSAAGQSDSGGSPQPASGSTERRVPYHGQTPPPVSVGDDIQVLLEQAERAISSINDPTPASPTVRPFELHELAGSPPSQEKASLNLLRDVELDLRIELGRSRMAIEELIKLRKGSVVPLDKLAGDPVDVFVNGRLVARGEVLVFNDNFCVRVAELVTGDQS